MADLPQLVVAAGEGLTSHARSLKRCQEKLEQITHATVYDQSIHA
ncbi:hypothetical protein [Halomicronema sp. CCY15110]|nr:hypothetical protein [Halomicronema sp. CCY15110]